MEIDTDDRAQVRKYTATVYIRGNGVEKTRYQRVVIVKGITDRNPGQANQPARR